MSQERLYVPRSTLAGIQLKESQTVHHVEATALCEQINTGAHGIQSLAMHLLLFQVCRLMLHLAWFRPFSGEGTPACFCRECG